MLIQGRGNMPTARGKRGRIVSGFMGLVTMPLTIAGWSSMTLPSAAQIFADYSSRNYYAYPYSYLSPKDYRDCSARLLKVRVPAPAVATACAQTLSPENLSKCVVDIKDKTNNTALDALNTCSQARRPTEVADCVVGISQSSSRKADPADLAYCGSSLLPGRFADCVVGLRRSLNFAIPTLALDTCISATDQLLDVSPNFVPQNGTPAIPFPTPTTIPTSPTQPVQPAPTPSIPNGLLNPPGTR